MKVLVLHSELGVLRGGGENFTRNLFTAFAERGHDVFAAFTAGPRGTYSFELPAALSPCPINGWWSSALGQSTLFWIAHLFPRDSRFRHFCDRAQQGVQWRVFAWHKRRFQRRVEQMFAGRWDEFDAVYVHGDERLAKDAARHRPTVLRLPGPIHAEYADMLRAVQKVCANGDALARTRAFLGEHVVELPVGLDTRAFSPGVSRVRSRLGWSDDDCVVGYVGRLTHLKGVDILAAAFRELAHNVPNTRLLIVGSGDAERHLHAVLASEIAGRVAHVEPDVEHHCLAEWYRAMDLFVMPSRYENHSNAILEAMACGLPFIASNVGGNTKLSEVGAGWLFESASVSSLSRCLHYALENPAERRVRAQFAVDAVSVHHSWEISAKRLELILSSALANWKGAAVLSNNSVAAKSVLPEGRHLGI